MSNRCLVFNSRDFYIVGSEQEGPKWQKHHFEIMAVKVFSIWNCKYYIIDCRFDVKLGWVKDEAIFFCLFDFGLSTLYYKGYISDFLALRIFLHDMITTGLLLCFYLGIRFWSCSHDIHTLIKKESAFTIIKVIRNAHSAFFENKKVVDVRQIALLWEVEKKGKFTVIYTAASIFPGYRQALHIISL